MQLDKSSTAVFPLLIPKYAEFNIQYGAKFHVTTSILIYFNLLQLDSWTVLISRKIPDFNYLQLDN